MPKKTVKDPSKKTKKTVKKAPAPKTDSEKKIPKALQEEIKALVKKSKKRGYITQDEIFGYFC